MTRRRTIGALAVMLLALLLLCACDGRVPTEATETRPLCVALGGETPPAAAFLTENALGVCEARGLTFEYAEAPRFDAVGDVTVRLLVGGREVTAHCSVVEDTTPPTLTGVRDLSFLLGEGAVLREGVSATDDCYGEVKLTVDASMLDTSRKGIYSVYYTATDGQGNATERLAYVTVYDTVVTEQMLDTACDGYLADLLPARADAETVCRRIHEALARDISYFPLSDKTDPTRAAYLALFVDGRGDCYSYFAAARSLLRRAGVECLAVERISEAGELRHYWLMVNLAREGESARWYHFDPTPLDAMGTDHNGCLFTDDELDAYNAVRRDFYRYDRTAYPATDTRSLR